MPPVETHGRPRALSRKARFWRRPREGWPLILWSSLTRWASLILWPLILWFLKKRRIPLPRPDRVRARGHPSRASRPRQLASLRPPV